MATQIALTKLNLDVEVINYIPSYIRNDREIIRHDRGIKIFLLDSFHWHDRKRKLKKFQRFLGQNLHQTEPFYSFDEVDEIMDRYKMVVIGSDQVWNPSVTGGKLDPVYFGAFTKGIHGKYSYASSLGDSLQIDKESEEIIKKYLADFNAVSVREESGCKWVRDHVGIDTKQGMDPTLLLQKKEWETFIEKDSPWIHHTPYIFVYSVGRTKELLEYARRVQKTFNCDILVSNSVFRYPSRRTKYIYDDGPQDFLSLIKNAAAVVTSSYHGTLFSVNFNVPFLSFPATHVKSNRSLELLKKIGLEDHFLDFSAPYQENLLKIDWQTVNRNLDEKREACFDYLKKVAEGAK